VFRGKTADEIQDTDDGIRGEANMQKTNVLTEARYAKLVRDIRNLIEEGKRRAVAAARQELVQTYWQIGRRISAEGLVENAGYGQAVLEDLAEELAVDYTTLTRCISFFQEYKVAPSGKNLTWSHYKRLLPVVDGRERRWYEDLAADEGLNAAQLGRAIQQDRYAQVQKSGGRKTAAGKLRRPAEPTYLYKAVVDRVIDGDTLLLRVDLGFQVWKEQRVRLAQIDAPALDEPKGREAYTFVLNQLARADFVMVKTNKIDVYGRYVGDVFYSFKDLRKDEIFLKGRYLNQELVERGLAKTV